MHVSFALHFKGSKRYTDILKKEIKQQSSINQCSAKHCIWIRLTKKLKKLKDKKYTVVLQEVQCFGLQFTTFLSTCQALKTCFELSRVKLRRNDLKGKQKLLRVNGRFHLSRVRVTGSKITVNVWRKSREMEVVSSQREVRVSKGSSYEIQLYYFICNL